MLTREYVREKCPVDHSRLTEENLLLLSEIIDSKMANHDLAPNYKCVEREWRPLERYAHIRCRSHYFDNREAVTFNTDGFVGFAGWADNGNVQPILEGFMDWYGICFGAQDAFMDKFMVELRDRDGVEFCHRTGSSYTCNPPVRNTDYDVVVYSYDFDVMLHRLELDGYEMEGGEAYGSDGMFKSLRKGSVNIILVRDLDMYTRFAVATKLAKRFNLLNKVDRIDLFKAVLYGTLEVQNGA